MFYKNERNYLHQVDSVMSLEFELYAESKDEYTYPVDGWYWFDTEEEARAFFNLD